MHNETSHSNAFELLQESVTFLQSELRSKDEIIRTFTAKNTVISPNFLAWKFCGKAKFPHSFGRFFRKKLHQTLRLMKKI